MNGDDQRPIPDDLRDRLAEEPAEERAALKRVWHMLGDAEWPDDEAPSADTTWAAVRGRLESEASGAGRSEQTSRHRMLWAVAAGVLLLVAAGLFFWQQPTTITVPAGKHAGATLPDGSVVELNSGTTLSFPRQFNAWPFLPADRRIVHLQGEAFFKVKPTDRPFIVETFNARVEVLGTQFNVRARADRDTGGTQVTLAEGRVRIQAVGHSGDAVMLSEAGQSSRVEQAASMPTRPRPVGIERALAWRQQGFAASDWPLSAILAELERRHDVRITVRVPAVLSDSMTLYYPRHTEAETIIHDIAVAKGLAYRATTRGFELTSQ